MRTQCLHACACVHVRVSACPYACVHAYVEAFMHVHEHVCVILSTHYHRDVSSPSCTSRTSRDSLNVILKIVRNSSCLKSNSSIGIRFKKL